MTAPPDVVEGIEALLMRAESLSDPKARELTTGLLRAVLDVYGAALSRVTTIAGETLTEELAADPHVSPLLLLHDLHPWDTRTRLDRALEAVGVDPADVTLNDGDGDWAAVATVRLRRTGRAPTPDRAEVEAAILRAVPEVERVEFAEPPRRRRTLHPKTMWPSK
jgi:hypothetical protein